MINKAVQQMVTYNAQRNLNELFDSGPFVIFQDLWISPFPVIRDLEPSL